MIIFAVDPGTEQSGSLVYSAGAERPGLPCIEPNGVLLERVRRMARERAIGWHIPPPDLLAVEMVASYGMPVGREIFQTVLFIGRLIEAWAGPFRLVTRIECKSHICHSAKAKDANIRQSLIDRFGPPGTKKSPGKLYGITSHCWSALAVAVTAAETPDKSAALEAETVSA